MNERSAAPAASTASGDTEAEITLGLLTAVEENESLTQRSAAQHLGIALGLTNAYLKRCIKKGLIKVNQVPPNRYAYYLTPQGFAEKSRLTAEYLTSSFTFFRRARTQCTELLQAGYAPGRRIAIWGATDLAEIAVLCSRELEIELAGVVDESAAEGGSFLGLPLAGSLDEFGEVDAVLVADLAQPQDAYDSLAAIFSADRLLTPALLRIRRTPTETETVE